MDPIGSPGAVGVFNPRLTTILYSNEARPGGSVGTARAAGGVTTVGVTATADATGSARSAAIAPGPLLTGVAALGATGAAAVDATATDAGGAGSGATTTTGTGATKLVRLRGTRAGDVEATRGGGVAAAMTSTMAGAALSVPGIRSALGIDTSRTSAAARGACLFAVLTPGEDTEDTEPRDPRVTPRGDGAELSERLDEAAPSADVSSAWATPLPAASAAPIPNVTAPAPNQA